MANIINNNFNFYKLKPYRGDYWDLTLNKDMRQCAQKTFQKVYDDNLIAYFDLSNNSLFDGVFVNCLDEYKWKEAYSTDYVLENIGYTGFDNGLLYFERDKIRNDEFLKLYSESKYNINSNDEKLKLHFVTGCTKQYSYDYEIEDDSVKLNGGFLQGFFKTEYDKYGVLPSLFRNGESINFEFVLKPNEMKRESLPRMNDVYPRNNGLFLYLGVRSENKWIYMYDKISNELSYDEYIDDSDIDVTKYKIDAFINFENDEESCYVFGEEYLENEIDISDFIYQTNDKSFTLGKYEEYDDYNNPFLLFNRTCDGFNITNKTKDSYIRYVNLKTKKKNENLFLTMNRTETGSTLISINKQLDEIEEYDIYADLYENALAFRITEDGKIGYRYLIKNCNLPNKMEIVEGYSQINMVKYNEWNHIVVNLNFIEDKMFFKFYTNGHLIFISKLLPKLNLRQLNEIYEKQETVPFNISVGGGTQGLIETILPNYMINPYRTYPLEENFGGSFIGYIKTFRIYLGRMSYDEILNNFKYEFNKI